MSQDSAPASEFILYSTEDGQTRIDILVPTLCVGMQTWLNNGVHCSIKHPYAFPRRAWEREVDGNKYWGQ